MTRREPGFRPPARPVRTIGVGPAIGIGLAAAVVLATVASLVTASALNRTPEVNELNDRVAEQAAELEGLRAEVADAGDLATRLSELEAELAASEAELAASVADNSTLDEQLAAREAQLRALQGEKEAVEEQLSALLNPTATWPSVDYGTALRGCVGCFSGDKYLLVLDVAVTNEGASTAWFSTADFKLKGPDGTVYPTIDQSPVAYARDGLPRGRIEILSQELQPGEEVRGSLVFYVGRNGVNSFTITYHDISESISVPE